jgi:hypothetical protein
MDKMLPMAAKKLAVPSRGNSENYFSGWSGQCHEYPQRSHLQSKPCSVSIRLMRTDPHAGQRRVPFRSFFSRSGICAS